MSDYFFFINVYILGLLFNIASAMLSGLDTVSEMILHGFELSIGSSNSDAVANIHISHHSFIGL